MSRKQRPLRCAAQVAPVKSTEANAQKQILHDVLPAVRLRTSPSVSIPTCSCMA